ncbi:MAG: transaldolase family protein [Armatimonadota bacterium]
MSKDIHFDETLAKCVQELALEGYTGPGVYDAPSQPKYARLRELGTTPWIDTGDASAAVKAWAPELGALTTNNTLVNQVIQTGALDEFIKSAASKLKAARPDISGRDLIVEIGFLANAKLALSLVQKFGVKVSVELHPAYANDIEASVNFGLRYFAINPEFFIIKVPITPAGYIVARKLAAAGVPINYTLGFSVRQNVLAAIFSKPAYVNVFLGRIGVLVADNKIGEAANVGEKVTLATVEALRRLRAAGKTPTKLIAASMRNGDQVALLAGVDVHTIPPSAAKQFLESPTPCSEVTRHESTELLVKVEDLRVSYLWQLCPKFMEFAEKAVELGDAISSGEQLVSLAEQYDIDMFYPFTKEQRETISKDGKIPVLAHFSEHVALDDLLTNAALESFATDQGALDARIEGLIS